MSIDNAVYALIFFLPAGISNMAPVFSSKLPGLRNWQAPLDFGLSYKGQRLFGKNKTWRGLLSGIVAGTAVGFLLHKPFFSEFDLGLFVLMCALMSAGALVGDATESFFKRQKQIPAGRPWFPFDQTDYIVGGLILVIPFGVLDAWLMLGILLTYFGLHLLMSYIGYLLGLKELPI